jgi:predicted metal-dependent phosphoesterase TrpH
MQSEIEGSLPPLCLLVLCKENPSIMPRVEFHCHTIYSKDSLLAPEKLITICKRKGIDRVVITDHNTTSGAVLAQQIDPQRVIVGEEIMTQSGELLAAFLQEEIPPGFPPLEAITRLRDQGAFISVSHPFDILRKGHWEPSDLEEILPLVDAIEVFNARCMSPDFNRQAQEFAQLHAIAGTAGSDAHAGFEIGRGAMLLPDFHDAASLKKALTQVQFDTRISSPLVHFTSRYAVWYKKIFNP